MVASYKCFLFAYSGDVNYGIEVTLNLTGTASPANYRIYTDENCMGIYYPITWQSGSDPVVLIPIYRDSVGVIVQAFDDAIVERLHETLDIKIVSAKHQWNSNINYACDTGVLNFKIEDNDTLDLQKVVFQNVRALQSDPDPSTGQSISWGHTSQTPNPNPNFSHWWKGKQLNKDPSLGYVPVAYSSQDKIAARAKWLGNVDPAIENALWAYFEVTVYDEETDSSQVFPSSHVQLIKGSDGSWVVDDESFKLPQKIATLYGQKAMYDPGFTLTWKFYVCSSDEEHRNAGVSESCLYVTYDDPAATLYHTVVHTGCAAANGVTPATSGNVDQPIFDAIWNKIKDLENYSVTIANGAVVNNELLMYYGQASSNNGLKALLPIELVNGTLVPTQFPSQAREFQKDATFNTSLTIGLLAKADGTCNAWADFMVNVLDAQGIQASLLGIKSKPTNSLPDDIYDAFKVKDNTAGQGTTTPKESIFRSHAVVEYDGKIYDPSYGLPYGAKLEALLQFVTRLESKGLETSPNQNQNTQDYGFVYVVSSSNLNSAIPNAYVEWS